MKITKVLLTALVLLTLSFFNAAAQDEAVAKVAGITITVNEFEQQFIKALPEGKTLENLEYKDKKEYLDLLINFRLKVLDGRERNLLEIDDLKKELELFRNSFLTSYFSEKKILKPYLDKVLERKKYEVRASHILINFPNNISAEDSVKAYEKFYSILSRIKSGEDFGKVAVESSDDPSAYMNKGDLYYFTSGMMVPEFEDKVYEMQIGEITEEPVKTMFGLHIIKLEDKKERVKSVKAGHIFIRDVYDSTGKTIDSLKTVEKALMILGKIKSGEDFGILAEKYSDDVATGKNGGLFGDVKRNYLIKTLDSLIFTLGVNDISDLARSPAGWHIIKVFAINPYTPDKEEYEEMKKETKRSQFLKNELANYISNSRERFNFSIDESGKDFLVLKFDTTVSFSRTKYDSLFTAEDLEIQVASSDAGEITLKGLISFLQSNRDFAYQMPTEANIINAIKEASTSGILLKIAYEEGADKDAEFMEMIENFENGLLIYKIDQEELMPKVKISDEEVQDYYNANSDKFTVKENDTEKVKPLEDVKTEILNILNGMKFKQLESEYVDELKKKYEVLIFNDVLEKTMEHLKTENEESEF